MKKWVIAATVGSLVIYFQNCARSNFETAGGNPDAAAQINPVVETPVTLLKPSDVALIELPNSATLDEQVVASAARAGDNPFHSYRLQVNPQTGLVKTLLADGSVDPTKLFCLSPEKTAELENLLQSAQLCEGKNRSQDADEICTMDYRFPYAKLQFPGREVTLGESFSGCHQGVDLCGSDGQALKSFLNSIVSHLQTANCHFENL